MPGGGRILRKHHTQLRQELSKNSTMFKFFSCSLFLQKGTSDEEKPILVPVPTSPTQAGDAASSKKTDAQVEMTTQVTQTNSSNLGRYIFTKYRHKP